MTTPKKMTLDDIIHFLRTTPHPIKEYPVEVLEQFDELMRDIEKEFADEENPTRDASTNLDDYIYG